MQRRDFIWLVGGAAAAWLFPLRAQQAGKIARIGYVRISTRDTDAYREWFLRGMRELGYEEGRNFVLESYYAGDDLASLTSLMDDVVKSKVDIIVTGGTPAIRAAQLATPTIPIVMGAVSDPVASGFVANLARPGGNITGVTMLSPDLVEKRLELLKEILPKATRVAILHQPGNSSHLPVLPEIRSAAESLGLTFQIFAPGGSGEFESVFAEMTGSRVDAAVILDDGAFLSSRARIATAAARQGLPLICGFREMAQAGCLLSYAAPLRENWRHAASFVDKILKGAKPADLPVEQPTKYELVINLSTAKALGLAVPRSLLGRADEVIE
jgi:putative ABC transport system substrate-binding protein